MTQMLQGACGNSQLNLQAQMGAQVAQLQQLKNLCRQRHHRHESAELEFLSGVGSWCSGHSLCS